ncbi:hypothetical protein AAMO2058_000478300 [Amorphochlora amoebiformis]
MQSVKIPYSFKIVTNSNRHKCPFNLAVDTPALATMLLVDLELDEEDWRLILGKPGENRKEYCQIRKWYPIVKVTVTTVHLTTCEPYFGML